MEIKSSISAKNVTTYGGDGILKRIYIPETFEEAKDILQEDNSYILGGGSNTLILDGYIDRSVVSLTRLDSIEIHGRTVTVGAGARLSRLIKTTREYGLGGLEFMAGVPATVGGLVRMNAGAFQHEIGVYVDKIVTLNAIGEIIEIFPPFDFGYRSGYGGVILEVCFRLDKVPKDVSVAKENEYKKMRSVRHPKGRSTGSVFKNTGLGAGYYIDKVGLKGTRKGGAIISPIHGNFIVNDQDGSAEDFLYLVGLAKERVYAEFGVSLKEEFTVLGEI